MAGAALLLLAVLGYAVYRFRYGPAKGADGTKREVTSGGGADQGLTKPTGDGGVGSNITNPMVAARFATADSGGSPTLLRGQQGVAMITTSHSPDLPSPPGPIRTAVLEAGLYPQAAERMTGNVDPADATQQFRSFAPAAHGSIPDDDDL